MFRKTDSTMKILITSRHENLSEGLKDHIQDKIQRVEKYLGNIREAHVILTFEKNLHTCEVNLVAKFLKLSAKSSSRDMYQSIDSALERLEKQARKQKEKRVERRHSEGGKALSVVHGLISTPVEGDEIKVIKTKKFEIKPMTVEEAALQLTASKNEFLVFFDAETDKTSVVYKRKDNHIGLISPDF